MFVIIFDGWIIIVDDEGFMIEYGEWDEIFVKVFVV